MTEIFLQKSLIDDIKKIVQFRIHFSNIQSIIICLQSEIQNPSSTKHQALTWSDYEKCNTISI